MIAKKACLKKGWWHASFYQAYKLPANETLPDHPLNCNTDEWFPNMKAFKQSVPQLWN